MAKGYDRDRERKGAVSLFGKDLARRAKSKCELCEEAGRSLKVYEVEPVLEEPNKDRCIMICHECIDTIERLDKMKQNDLRFLGNAIWSEVDIVKAYSIAMLRKLEKDHHWASDILEMAYIDAEMEELINSIEV